MLLILCLIYNLFIANNMYTQYYSNSRHDSFINSIPKVNGKILREIEISDKSVSNLEIRVILTDGKDYFLDTASEIICFTGEGKIKWRRSKWYGSQVVLNNKLLFYQSAARKDDMEAVDYQNNIVISKYPISGVIDESQIILFQPATDGLIAQIYYSDLVDTSVPEYLIFQALKKSLGFIWHKRYYNQICPSLPLVNYEKGFVLTFSPTQGQIFILGKKSDEADPDYSFDLPKDYNSVFASSSKAGDIYLAYTSKHFVNLKCLSLDGKEKYSVEVADDFVDARPVLCPPVLTPDGFIFILTNNKVFCIKDKKLIWSKVIRDINFATAFADNSVIIAAANKLIRLDAKGNELLNYEAEGKIFTPPVLDDQGRLMFGTKTTVYLME